MRCPILPLALLATAALTAASAGCLGSPLAATPDAGLPPSLDAGTSPDAGPGDPGPPLVAATTVTDAVGAPWSAQAAPRRPIFEVDAPSLVAGEPAWLLLFEGPPEEDLASDLERPPLAAARVARLIPATVTPSAGGWVLRPVAPLALGARDTLGVGAWASDSRGRTLSAPFTLAVTVASKDAGAVVTDTWPGDSTFGAPPDLPLIAVRFDDIVLGSAALRLRSADGADIAATSERIDCAEVGWRGGSCLALRPKGPLQRSTDYQVSLDPALRDRTGASPGPLSLTFRTATDDSAGAVGLLPLSCALDEQALGSLCVRVDERTVTVRAQAAGPVRAWLGRDDGMALDPAFQVAPRGAVALTSPLPPKQGSADADGSGATTLRIVDLAGREQRFEVAASADPGLAQLYITEVRSDPAGPEPRQEYVELWNAGDTPVDLDGFSISDTPDRVGDVVMGSFVVPAGARVLLVADAFDPASAQDAPVPDGTPLLRVGSALASGGISNSGEPLFLRDADGRRVSAAPAFASVGAGVCFVRVVEDGRSGEAGTFAPNPIGCSPGTDGGEDQAAAAAGAH